MKKLNNKYYFLFILAFLFVLTGCKVKRPKEVISEGKMEELLYDYHLAKAMGDNLPYNENYKKVLYVEYVFQKYNTTEAVFDSSMVWYTRHADVLSKIYEKVGQRLKAQQTEINRLIALRDHKPRTSAPGDSIDVWLLERIFRLTSDPLSNKIAFVIPTDTNFKERDTLLWNMRYRYLGAKPDSTEAAIMAMQIKYANDSIIHVVKKIFQSGIYDIRLHSDSLGGIKEIRGFVYYNGRKDSLSNLMADRISLMRYHSRDTLAAGDSIKADSIKADSIRKKELEKHKTDSLQVQPVERQSPGDLRGRPRPRREALKENELK